LLLDIFESGLLGFLEDFQNFDSRKGEGAQGNFTRFGVDAASEKRYRENTGSGRESRGQLFNIKVAGVHL
jgi:hypothetical protein